MGSLAWSPNVLTTFASCSKLLLALCGVIVRHFLYNHINTCTRFMNKQKVTYFGVKK